MKTSTLFAIIFAAISCWARTVDSEWATISVPDVFTPDASFAVEVTPKAGIPEGQQVSAHLYWMKERGWGGFLSYAKGQSAVADKAVKFYHKKGTKPGLHHVQVVAFLSPDGDYKKKTKDMKVDVPLAEGAASVAAPAKTEPSAKESSPSAPQTVESDWATVSAPAAFTPDTSLAISVTPKAGIPEGQQVSAHLYWMKERGWGGFFSYAKGQDAVAGKTVKIHHKKGMKPGLASVYAIVFLSPDGDYKKKTKEMKVTFPLAAASAAAPAASAPAEKSEAKAKGPVADPNYPVKPDSVKFKKSAIWLESAPTDVRAGEPITVKIHYILDPSDTWGDKPTQLTLQPLGPWIDNPDGVVNKKRMHVGYPGLPPKTQPAEVGEHVAEFTFTPTKTFRYNGLSYRAMFKRPDGLTWPWEWRGAGMSVARENDLFIMKPTALGGLFVYGEKPEFTVEWGKRKFAATEGTVTVRDVNGKTVLERKLACDPAAGVTKFALDGLETRGCFSVTLDLGDVGSDYCYFGTIPAFRRESGKRTPFGITNIRDERWAKLGEKLGFSYTRLFTTWKELETNPGNWHLDGLDKDIALNFDNGLKPWICLYAPPAWALPEGMWATGYEPSPFDLKAWGNAITVLGKRYGKKLYGFEWLNEIVPGSKCKDPVAEYVEICKTGYKAAKAVDPQFVCQLAGGLWPHNYRIDCLNSGVGDWIDVLPVHYSTYDGVIGAQEDLEVRDITKVGVADNETAKGMTVWNMTPAMTLEKSLVQCLHVMTRWPDELCAGSNFITYFGGSPDPCGNWCYLLDDSSPRPVAVTLAVVQGKIGYASAVGKFHIDGCPIQLFERDGKAIAFVASADGKPGEVTLPVKDSAAKVTDYLGNETSAPSGKVAVGEMPVIVEDLDLELMKLHAAVRVGTSKLPAAEPQVVTDVAEEMRIPVLVRNVYAAKKGFTLVAGGADWGTAKPVAVELAAGESKALELVFAVKPEAKVPAMSSLKVNVATKGIEPVDKPFILYAIDPASIGNLVKNGDFENGTDGWKGKDHKIVASPMPDNAENHAMQLKGTGKGAYKSCWQGNVPVPVPGQSYLYSCWAKSDSMFCGSNMSEAFTDGTKNRNYIALKIFSIGQTGSQSWRYLSKRFDTKPNTASVGLAPVGDGVGSFQMDNISFSLYRGTDFAAFAGRKGGEKASSKIPLLCDNQIRCENGYVWKPEGFAGIAEFSWDESALSFRCTVEDDVSSPKLIAREDGAESFGGDMLAIAVYPKIGADGMPESAQERWYLSLANTGGGSGKTTLFRPKRYALGLKDGQLAKDSSVYQVDFRREGTKTIYDLRIPWSEMPGFTPAKGASFGCNLVLVDNDGGAGIGKMIWGADLSDSASGCGLVTLLP